MNQYLQNIKFKTKDVNKFVRDYLGNMRIVVLVVLAILVGGFLSYKALPQTVAPEINLSMIVVSSTLPGAPPEDVETLLTIPIEDELKGISHVDTITSVSENSYMYSVLTFNRGVDQSRALDDVENAIRRLGNLPEDATDPNIKAVDFEDAPILRLALTIDGDNKTSLSSHVQKLVDTLEADPLIDRVATAGQPNQEVQITISFEKMAALNLQPLVLQQLIKNAVATIPSGTVENIQMTRALTINTSIEDVADLRLLPISIDSKLYTLGDIATIAERPAPGFTNAWLGKSDTSLRSIVTLDIYRTSGVNLTEAAKKAEGIIAETINHSDGKLHQTVLMSIASDLTKQFDDLTRNLGLTILLVFITLMLFVGWRQALLAAFSIPLTYAIAFIVMGMMNISVNFLSLFSLLLSLGLLVDVTIVIVSAMSAYMREGLFSSYKTGLLVYRDFFKTLLITTLTTVWAFVPLLLTEGMMGEYLRSIPIIVSSILLASVFIGIFIILPLMIWLFDFFMPRRVHLMLNGFGIIFFSTAIVMFTKLPIFFVLGIGVLLIIIAFTGKIILTRKYLMHNATEKEEDEVTNVVIPSSETNHSQKPVFTLIRVSGLERYYRNLLNKILSSKKIRRQTIIMIVLFFFFSFGLVGTGFVKNEFFPGEDIDFIFASMELPQGTKASITEKEAKNVLEELIKLEGVADVTLQTGFEIDNNGGINSSTSNTALFTIMTPSKDIGGLGSQKVASLARALPIVSTFSKGKITIVEFTGGPPAGADVVVTFVGDDINTLRKLAHNLKTYTEKNLPIENITISPRLAAATVEFVPDDLILSKHGLTKGVIASQLHLFASGFVLADDIEFGNLDKKRDIVLRFDTDTPNLETLGRMMISTPQGNMPLETLGHLKLVQNISRIKRDDFERIVTFTASLKEKANLVEVNKEITKIINEKINFPSGYSWQTGGANEENQKSVQSILKGMLLALALIFLTLIIHLKSYRKAAIVLLTIPPAASGVFVIFALTGISLSFPALIGILALFGIVVNNAIIVVSQINANQKVGMGYKQSIVEGSASRLEPILLSSLTTIIGLMPITLSDPVWQGLGGAIISGLIFSGTIMLFFIPTVYYGMMGDEK